MVVDRAKFVVHCKTVFARAEVSPIPHRAEAEPTPVRENPQHVAEYAEDIFALHAQDETRFVTAAGPGDVRSLDTLSIASYTL